MTGRTNITMLLVASLGLLAGFGASSVHAQWSRHDDHFVSEVQIGGSRAGEQLIAKAKKDYENKEWDRCVRNIQKVLDEHASGALTNEEGRFVGIRDFCNSFINSLPEEGRDAYRKIFDPYAKDLYERGLAQHDTDALKEVYRRYLETSYGRPALDAAVWLLLERGELHTAIGVALLYRETYPTDAAGAARMSTAIVSAARMLGDETRLRQLQRSLTAADKAASIDVAGSTTTVGEYLETSLDGLQGSPSRRAGPDADMFGRRQWETPIEMFERRGNTYALLDDFGRGGRPSDFYWNPVIPALDDGTAYFSNGLSVHAVSIFSGEEKWAPFQGPANVSQARRNLGITFPITVDRGRLFTALEAPVRSERRIWNFTPEVSVPHRQLFCIDSATGKQVWTHHFWRGKTIDETEFVNELSVASAPLVIGDDVFVAATRFHTSYHHYLCCFDRHTGEPRWWTFVCTGQMEQNMFGNRVRECVAGSIAERDGVLYYSTNIGVVAAVDSRLGTLKFTVPYRQIPIPRQTRFNTQVHERAPSWYNAPPVIVDDWVVFAPMDSNELLAVHRHTGHKRVIDNRERGTRHRYLVGSYRGWVIVAGLNLAFYDARSEFRKLVCPDLGRRHRVDQGIQGTPIIIGNRLYCTALNQTAQQVFVLDLDRQFKLIDEYRFPRSRRRLSLGNLASTGDVVVLAATDPGRGETVVSCYFDKVRVRREIEEAIRANPLDVKLHLRSGELHLQSKNFPGALKAFEAAWRLAKDDPQMSDLWGERARESLYRLYLQLARQPGVARSEVGLGPITCFERAFEYARHRGQQLDILFLLLGRAARAGEWDTFERNARRIVDSYGDDPYDYQNQFEKLAPELTPFRRYPKAGMVATLVSAALANKLGRTEESVGFWQELIRTWPDEFVGSDQAWQRAHKRIGELIEKHGRAVYARWEKQADVLWAKATSGDDVAALQRILDLYPNSKRVSDAYLEISRRHLAADRHSLAVRTVHEFFWRFGEPSGELLRILGEALERLDCAASARQVWRFARDVAPRATVDDGGNPVTLGELAKRKLGDDRLVQPRDEVYALPAFGLEPKLLWDDGQESSLQQWVLVEPKGTAPASMKGRFLVHHGEELLCRSLEGGAVAWRVTAKAPPWDSLMWSDGRLVGLLDEDLVCLDPADGTEHWRRSETDGRMTAVNAGQGKVYAVIEPRSVATRFNLKARSILDGETVFESSYSGSVYGELPVHSRISVSDRWVAVPVQYENYCVVLDAFTGRPAAGMKGGHRYVQPLIPILTANGLVVSMTRETADSAMQLVATEPASGRVRWSRKIGEGRANIRYRDERTLVYDLAHRSSPRVARSRWTLVAVDLVRGNAMLQHDLEPGVRVRKIFEIAPNDVFVVSRKTTENFHVQIYVEDLALSTRSRRWSTVNFPGALDVLVLPFDKGVLLRVTERHFKSRTRAFNRSTLYTVDGTGRLRQDIKLDEDVSSFEKNIMIVDGRLVVADGPKLKVYQP